MLIVERGGLDIVDGNLKIILGLVSPIRARARARVWNGPDVDQGGIAGRYGR